MPTRRSVIVDELQQTVRATLVVDVGSIWDRLLGETLREYLRLDREGLAADAIAGRLESFLEGLSAAPEVDLARGASAVSYNLGRRVELEQAADEGEAQYVVRSEILDDNTCEACERLDGLVFEINSPDFRRYMPPNGCLGRERCRGFHVPVGRGVA